MADPAGATPGRVDPDCELCEAAEFTTWHHQDDRCWVAECDSCDDPMVVWRSHGTDPGDEVVEHMLSHLRAAADTVFGNTPYRIDQVRRTIPDHWHAHARIDRLASWSAPQN